MHGNSRTVSSNQGHIHPRLGDLVHRHLLSPSRRPVAEHSRRAFAQLEPLLREGRPRVLDSFCGTGHSTAALAQRHPGHLVVGVDKSAARLDRHPPGSGDNCLLLQADCEDIWRLLLQRGARLHSHYLLYPNPWPKSRHLQRRVQGSAAFPLLLRLGGRVELRSNWQLYVEEFGAAMHFAGCPGVVAELAPRQPLTLFEAKYRASGQTLWRFTTHIGAFSAP